MNGRTIRTLMLLLAALFIGGCATTNTGLAVSDEVLATIDGKSMSILNASPSNFLAGSGLSGAFGNVDAMKSSGRKLVGQYGVQDPATYIRQSLADDYAVLHNVSVLQAGSKDADLSLDIRTSYWGIEHFDFSVGKYRVVYSVMLKLVDVSSGEVLAEEVCGRWPNKSNSSPSRDQLVAGNASMLKQELKTAADFCINYFKTTTLRM